MNLYVGNLSNDVTEEDLRSLFSVYGNLTSVKVIKDNFTGTSKGFGFVEIPGNSEGQKAINELNSQDLKGKKIVVNEARPKTDRPSDGGSRNSKNNYGSENRGKW